MHVYKSKLSFTLFKGFTSTKILLANHYTALGGDSFYIATLKLMFYTYGCYLSYSDGTMKCMLLKWFGLVK